MPVVLAEQATPGTSVAVAMGVHQVLLVADWPDRLEEVASEVLPTKDDFSRVLGLDAARGSVFAGEWTGLHVLQQNAESIGPDVEVSPASVQLGEDGEAVLVVRNRGNRPLTVGALTTPPELSVDRDCFRVEPGAASAVEIGKRTAATIDSEIRGCSDDPDEPTVNVPVTSDLQGVGVGDPAPEFVLQDLDGNTWTSDQLQGNIAVLAYFATF